MARQRYSGRVGTCWRAGLSAGNRTVCYHTIGAEMNKLTLLSAMLISLSAGAADDDLIAFAKYAVRQNLKSGNLAFKDVLVNEIYHIENGRRVQRGNTMCGKVDGRWFQVVKYEYGPTVEVSFGLDDNGRLPCYKDVVGESFRERHEH